jgi:dTDP-4-amino-4,6-dideoxygalactose transaminase
MSGVEMNFIQKAFDSNWIAPLGPNVDGFEKDVARYVGLSGAVALSSGTAAVHLALKYFGVTQGDYVFCSSLTFAGTCNPIIYEKAIPVFIDSEPESWNMSPLALEKAFNSFQQRGVLPKAVIIVNLYGQSADMDKLLPICKRYGVPVIEDAAESLGATYHGKASGTFGRFGIFSFNGNKIITTSGGGMVVSDDMDGLKKIKFWATQAREAVRYYEHKEIGYNYRMSNIVAAIGRGQIGVLNDRVRRKKEVFASYKEAFRDIPEITLMPIASFGEPNYWLTVITIDPTSKISPESIITKLEENNIESRPIWKPMHLQPVFKGCEYYMDTHDIGANLFKRGVCLPSGTSMTDEEQNNVIDLIRSLFRGGNR